MLEELLSFDVTVVKPNCYRPAAHDAKGDHQRWRAWICERHHSGQRLVHALAAGVPAVVWGASQGFLDVLRHSAAEWPLAWSDDQAVDLAVSHLLANRTLRCSLAAAAPKLAEPYHIAKVLEHYALMLGQLLP